jgi:putative nucleotidyltransferase with HDIG domain
LTDCDLVPASNLTSIRVFAAFVTVVAACAIAVSLATSGSARWEVLLVLAAAAWIAESRGMPLNSIELSVSFIPIVLAAVVFGPAAGGLVGLAGMLGDRRGPLGRFSIYASTRAIAGVVGGAAALVVAHAIGRSTLLDVLAATLVAGLGYVTIDLLSTMVVGHMRGHVSPRQVWQQLRAAEAMTMALYTPLTALYAFAYGVAGAWVMAFIAIPLLAAHLSYSLYARQSQLIDQLTTTNARLGEANQHLRRVNLSFAAAMVRALDARDAWTAGHSAAVAVYSRDIAREMGMSEHEIEMVHLTGLVHDIGKIGVRAEVLQKTSALNDDEWAEMRRHSEIGANILIEVEGYSEVARIVRSHHERFDGAGYPDGLAREEIPLLARIIAVADAYNAMTSTRPYRNAMAPDVAIQQLVNGRGSQFQVDLVDAFVRVLQRESDSYRLGLLADFSLESMQHPELSPPAVPLRAAVA